MKTLRALHLFVWAAFSACHLAACCSAQDTTIRIATYNTSLYRRETGQLVRDLEAGDNDQARSIAEVVQRVRPDVLLLNEFDYDPAGRAAELFRSKYLAVGQKGCETIEYDHFFAAPVNTGRPSGRDLDKDGRLNGPNDAIGFGRHHGQYGMLFLSRFPIDRERVRTFRRLLWRDMPGAMLPTDPATGASYYNDEDLAVLRLASKSFWDIPIHVPAAGGSRPFRPFTLHVLCSHPTPPVFDGPEDRNGRRNHDEVRFIADYLDAAKSDYLVDDAGSRGGLPAAASFVILGDLNADPVDGDSVPGTLDQLLKHPGVNASFTPDSAGGKLATERGTTSNRPERGDPAHDTADFETLNLRVDYALPSRGLTVTSGGVFWPTPGEPGSQAITATDHRLVWIDIRPE
jgi:endonuclease/exonuclease/phosphatase family metal-dependent hydrolase